MQKNCTTAIYLFYSAQKMYSCIFTSQLQIGIIEKMYNCYFSSQMQKNCTTFMASVICPYLPFRITCKNMPWHFSSSLEVADVWPQIFAYWCQLLQSTIWSAKTSFHSALFACYLFQICMCKAQHRSDCLLHVLSHTARLSQVQLRHLITPEY